MASAAVAGPATTTTAAKVPMLMTDQQMDAIVAAGTNLNLDYVAVIPYGYGGVVTCIASPAGDGFNGRASNAAPNVYCSS